MGDVARLSLLSWKNQEIVQRNLNRGYACEFMEISNRSKAVIIRYLAKLIF